MEATIYVDAKTAVAEGLDNSGAYKITFRPESLTEAQRKELARCSFSNEKGFEANGNDSLCQIKVGAPTLENFCKILDNRIEERAAREKKKKDQEKEEHLKYIKRIKAWMETDDEKKMAKESYGSYSPTKYYPHIEFVHIGIDTILERFKDEIPGLEDAVMKAKAFAEKKTKESLKRFEQIKKERAEKKAAEEAEAKRIEKEKKEYIEDWVSANGTDNQKARLKDGVLPEKEIIDEIREELFKNLCTYDRYEKLKQSDIPCNCDGYMEPEASFSVDDKDKLTAVEYDILQNMKEDMPEAEYRVRNHIGECDECEEKIERTSVHVTAKTGPFVFTREYAL